MKVATQIIPYIFYRDVPAAIEWLARAFGFAEMMRTATPRGGMHAQMALDGQQIMMGRGATEWGMRSAHQAAAARQGVFTRLADVDARCERSRAAGAPIDNAPEALPYGRSSAARDLDGHPWFFATPPANG